MKKMILCFLCFLLLISLIGCSDENLHSEQSLEKFLGVEENNEALQFFKEKYPDYKLILAAEKDVTANQLKDIILIFNSGKEQNSMVVIMNKGGGEYKLSNELPAPAENQKIEFKDIDNKPPMEFIISGSKGIYFGLAIFRIIEGEVVDLFADGFEDCC